MSTLIRDLLEFSRVGKADIEWNETDLTLSYGGAYEKLGYGVGWIYYDLDGIHDTQEL